ncbi:MAG: hypothetical protein ACFE9D_02925 [Promethearchaeota archaeon]
MPSKENDLDEAYSRFRKRLKSKEAAQNPIEDEALRTRLEEVDRQAPSKSTLFIEADSRLEQLKEEFHIEVQKPQTLQEHVVFLLARDSVAAIVVADLYSKIHEMEQYKRLSHKEFQKQLKQLEKEEKVRLSEIQGVLVIKLHDEFLSEDEATILDVAARKSGKISMEQIMVSTGWSQARTQMALDSLAAKKMLVQKKSFTRGTRYQLTKDT